MFENWVLNNRYMIVKEIAQGGFATIYKGWDMNLKKIVAVKKIHAHFAGDAKFVDMFRKEALNTARFDHSNIVKVINFLKDASGNYYIILEYVKGISLDYMLQKVANASCRLPEKIALYIIRETASALQYVYELTDESTGASLNIIHRDISPGNIMIYYNGKIKLTDFGIATGTTAQKKSQQGKLLGKFAYMSPEQAFGDVLDTRSDLFSLGVVLYEILAGQKLYTASSELELLAKVKSVKIDFGKLSAAGISEGTVVILGKLLEKKPEKRYQTPQELVDAINSLLDGDTTQSLMEGFADLNKKLLTKEWSHIRADIEAESTGSLDVLEQYALNDPPPHGAGVPSALGESEPVSVSPAPGPQQQVPQAPPSGPPAPGPQQQVPQAPPSGPPAPGPQQQVPQAPPSGPSAPESPPHQQVNPAPPAGTPVPEPPPHQVSEPLSAGVPGNSAAASASSPPFAQAPPSAAEGKFHFEPVDSPAPAVGPQIAGAPEGEKEKTVFDFVLDTAQKYKKIFISGALAALAAFIVYTGVDTYFQLTDYGTTIHNFIWPPAMVINSIPTDAEIMLEQDNVDIILAEGYSSRTPSNIERIPPGVYTLRLTKTGYGTVERRVTVLGAKKGEQSISIAGARSSEDNVFTVPFEVMLEVDSTPSDAEVYIDGRKIGETPFAGAVPIDTYNIQLFQEGFEPLGSDTPDSSAVGVCFFDASRPADEQNMVDRRFWKIEEGTTPDNMKLFALHGNLWKQISVNSSPSGAAVYINEDYRGDTPLVDIPVPSGNHDIRMVLRGYNDYTGTIEIGGAEDIDSVMGYLSKRITIYAYEAGDTSTDINASVTVRGTNFRGTTPFSVTLPARTYSFILEKDPEYEPVTVSRNIASISNRINVSLERRNPHLSLTVRDFRTNERVPDAMVWINGSYWRRTNALGVAADHIEQPPGEFNIEVQADGHDPLRTATTIDLGDRRELEIVLGAPSDGAIIVDASDGFGAASIYVNGEYMGQTLQQVMDLSRSQHLVEVRGSGIEEPLQLRVNISEPNQLLIVKLSRDADGRPELNELDPELYWDLYR